MSEHFHVPSSTSFLPPSSSNPPFLCHPSTCFLCLCDLVHPRPSAPIRSPIPVSPNPHRCVLNTQPRICISVPALPASRKNTPVNSWGDKASCTKDATHARLHTNHLASTAIKRHLGICARQVCSLAATARLGKASCIQNKAKEHQCSTSTCVPLGRK